MKFTSLLLAAAVAASATMAMPAAAVEVVFANVTATQGANFRFVRGIGAGNGANATFGTTATATSTTLGAATNVLFSLSGAPVPLSIAARLTLSGSTTGDAVGVTANGAAFSQNLDSFTFNVAAVSGFTYGSTTISAGQSLLSGSVQNGQITGNIGGTTGALNASSQGGATVLFNSGPLFAFAPGSDFGFSFNLGSVNPGFATSSVATALTTFRAQAGGSFQSDPAPVFTAEVPEPSSWAMMIIGMGLVGVARRRRSTVVAA